MSLLTDLVAYWALDEASGNRSDSHGSNTLQDQNTVTSAAGKISTAAQFASANSEYLSVADNTTISMGDIDFSIQAWFKTTTITGNAAIVSKWGAAGQREYAISRNAATLQFAINTPASAGVTVSWGSSISADTWYHVIAYHDATANVIGIVVNAGTPVTQATSAGVRDGTISLRLGAHADGSNYFNGLIDEVGIWKRVLTSQERTDLYNGGSGLSYDNFVGGGTTVVNTDLATTWNIRQTINADKAAAWNVRSLVQKDAAQAWNVRAAVGQQTASAWNIRSLVTADKAATWNVRQAIVASLAAAWNVRALVTADRAATWHIRQVIQKDATTAWQVRALVAQSLDAAWNVRSLVAADLASTWNIAGVLGLVSVDLASAWNVRALATNDATAAWNVRAVAAQQIATAWNVRRLAQNDMQAAWNVRVPVGQQVSAAWQLRALATKDLIAVWRVESDTILIIVTPPERTHHVAPELRVARVASEVRIHQVQAERRVHHIPPEQRVRTS